ncbi:TrkA C-terminal domain-containing protein [Wukongibacter baidiensis]|uniref:TrkA C-terminal domain-containing protein n=1 Tax=Wukongibacter baidiensis TaxID=1723361 RepID=UPI003D7F7057
MTKSTNKDDVPKYIKIALDIAYRIHNNEFKVGDKLRGRSILAGEYNVSPETIRKAAGLLQDMGVVNINVKSGIYVESIEKSKDVIKKFDNKKNVNKLKKDIKELIKHKNEIEKDIESKIESILERSTQFKMYNEISTYDVIVEENSHMIGRTVLEIGFWEKTGATVVAVKRDEELMVSPGPHIRFKSGDRILYVCKREFIEKVNDFVNKPI